MELDKRGRWHGTQLLAQQNAQTLERLQRLGDVPTARLGVHHERVPTLAERELLDEPLRRGQRRGQPHAAQLDSGPSRRLERLRLELGVLAAEILDPPCG